MSLRSWLISVLCLWLIFAVARQAFDLVGKLWIPVGFDLLQILCCIIGLFGVCQNRFSLIIALLVSSGIAIAHNALVFFWYLGYLGDRNRPLLSGGLPYSFSFFLRYTPGCVAHFDLTRYRWVQSSCYLAYYQIEATQTIIHMLFAMATIVLSSLVLWEKRNKPKSPKPPTPAQYAQIQQRTRLPKAPSSINDISSGYMNSSYEDVSSDKRHPPQPLLTSLTPQHRNYERNEKKVASTKKCSKKQRPNSMPQPNADHYSSPETEEVVEQPALYTKPLKSSMRSSSNGSKYRKNERSRNSTAVEVEHEEAEVDVEVQLPRELRSSTGNLTSLVSFDPKSSTLIRVREHRDSEEEEIVVEGCIRGPKLKKFETSEENVYEKIRQFSSLSDISAKQQKERMSVRETWGKNPSQESVPSMMAPVLSSSATHSPHDGCSTDSGMHGSTSGEWTAPTSLRVASWHEANTVTPPSQPPQSWHEANIVTSSPRQQQESALSSPQDPLRLRSQWPIMGREALLASSSSSAASSASTATPVFSPLQLVDRASVMSGASSTQTSSTVRAAPSGGLRRGSHPPTSGAAAATAASFSPGIRLSQHAPPGMPRNFVPPGISRNIGPPPAMPRDMAPPPTTPRAVASPGIRLTGDGDGSGIRLTNDVGSGGGGADGSYRSAFHVQPQETTIIGHYHAHNEFELNDDRHRSNNARPVINGAGLLV